MDMRYILKLVSIRVEEGAFVHSHTRRYSEKIKNFELERLTIFLFYKSWMDVGCYLTCTEINNNVAQILKL